MIRLVVMPSIFASLLLAAPSHAVDEVSEIDFCRDYSLIAKDIMTARQKNRPMSETIPKAADRIKSWSEKYGVNMDKNDAEKAAASMVMAAYREAIAPVESYQRITITEFENDVFKECYESATSDSEE